MAFWRSLYWYWRRSFEHALDKLILMMDETSKYWKDRG